MGLGRTQSGKEIDVDLEILLKTRLLVTASSGGGKTGALFALCEQFAGKVQIIVLDPEGEFPLLRQKFPFLLVGPDGETPAMVKTAKLLAHRLLELNVSAICDIYELPVHQRHEFVRDFLDAMVDSPKTLWHPVLVIVDEAHVYGPEKGQGESVAMQSLVNMASRGRKRGFALIAATQRLAKLSKNIASELQNQLVGRTTQVDQARAADVLNLSGKAARDDFGRMIGQMPTADFMAYGMAFGLSEPTRFTVKRPLTLPTGTEKRIIVPPAPASVKALLPKLADLPNEAEKKQKTEEDLRAEIRELKQQVRGLSQQGISPERERMLLQQIAELQKTAGAYEKAMANIHRLASDMAVAAGKIQEAVVAAQGEAQAAPAPVRAVAAPSRPAALPRPAKAAPRHEEVAHDGEPLSGPEQRIVDAVAWFEKIGVEDPEQPAVAFMANYTYGSGGYNNPRGRLKQRGLVEYLAGDRIALTPDGRKVANYPTIEPTNEALHSAVLAKMPGPEQRILKPLLKAYPKGIDNLALAEAANYAPGSGGFNNPRGRLKSLGLIEYRDGIVYARSILFPEG